MQGSRIIGLFLVVATVATARAEPRTVVIDPGHGGTNTGAPGYLPGVYEKQVTLAVARELAARLHEAGVRVVLTRSHDRYLTVRERMRIAKALHADCFVSLHTNAAPDHAHRGVETYLLSRDSTDVEARRAAVRQGTGVASLLTDLEMLDAEKRALELARDVQGALVQARVQPGEPASLLDRGVRQATDDVLAGATMPAILVEMGYIDHPIEGPELVRPDMQRRIADGIARGILDFLEPSAGRPHLAALAHRRLTP